MRRILLASAAVLALALAAPAGAQYPDPTPTPAPYQTQPEPPPNDAMAPPQTTEAPAAPAEPSTTQTDPSMTQTDPYAPAPAQQAQTPPDAYAQTPADASATPAAATNVDLTDVATMAGMDSVPMTATEVCQPRSVSLTQSSSRLNRDARRHLINATDYASVCKMQRVVIHSPDGRGAAARETMIANGVDESLIQVEQSSGGGLGVEMTFAGLAASSEEYAAMFNPVQTASYAPATAPSYQSPPAEPSGQTDMGEPGASAPTEPTVPAGDDSGYTAPRPPPEQQQTPTQGY